MIAVYPMLVSKHVNPNVLPGICKVLERFVIIYDLDDVCERFSLGSKVTIGAQTAAMLLSKRKNKNFRLDEANNQGTKRGAPDFLTTLDDREKRGYDRGHSVGLDRGVTQGRTDALNSSEERRREVEHNWRNAESSEKIEQGKVRNTIAQAVHDLNMETSKSTAEINYPRTEALTVEPTYVTVNTKRGTELIGIKVIPFVVNSSENLGRMLMTDMTLKGLDKFMYANTRKIFRAIYQVHRWASKVIPFIKNFGDDNISGDPEKDILFAST